MIAQIAGGSGYGTLSEALHTVRTTSTFADLFVMYFATRNARRTHTIVLRRFDAIAVSLMRAVVNAALMVFLVPYIRSQIAPVC